MKSYNVSDLENLDPKLAKKIINAIGSAGQPPVYGYQYFSAGLDSYLTTLDEEYLSDFVKDGGSAFKLVVGAFGGGKTHFLYHIQNLAWKRGYMTSYIQLSANTTPFHKLEAVYSAIAENLMYDQPPLDSFGQYKRGIGDVIQKWYSSESTKITSDPRPTLREVESYLKTIGQYDSISFQNAVRLAFHALYSGDDGTFNVLMQWLKGETTPSKELKDLRIVETINKTNAFKMIRCLIRWIEQLGYTGLVILMDEAEQKVGLSTKDKATQLSNLRELIEACSTGFIEKTLIFYAVPDEKFLEGKTGIYDAVRDRLATVFYGYNNPTGTKIILDNLASQGQNPIEILTEIGQKISKIYEVAYKITIPSVKKEKVIAQIANDSYEARYGEIGYMRLFVQSMVKELHQIKAETA